MRLRDKQVGWTPWSARDALVPPEPARGPAADQGVRPTLLVFAALLLASAAGAQVQYARGQNVAPVFEGWETPRRTATHTRSP